MPSPPAPWSRSLEKNSWPPPAGEAATLALHESLERLGAESERHARTIECRFFGGMTVEETAEALDISAATVKRGTAVARPWLARDLEAFRGG